MKPVNTRSRRQKDMNYRAVFWASPENYHYMLQLSSKFYLTQASKHPLRDEEMIQ